MSKCYITVARGWYRSEAPPCPLMLPAASYWNGKFRKPKLPTIPTELAVDCGGFVATRVWGDYRFTREAYVDWCRSIGPSWAATWDWCCEDEITSGNRGIVRERQKRTTDAAWDFTERFADVPWQWVPTIQGWQTDDYLRHVEDLKPLLEAKWLDYVGIGTLCRRGSQRKIHEVVNAIASALPNARFHLWGVKLPFFKSVALNPAIESFDTAAWNGMFGTGIERWRKSAQSRRLWASVVALPEYLMKVDTALSEPKQAPLF